jgi:replication-associated recombination protein RarA
MAAIHETLRPTTLDEMVGHSRQRKQIALVRKTTGLVGQAFWLVGASGTGKTTMARAIANEVADEFTIHEIDAIDLTLDQLREWERSGAQRPLFGGGFAFVINEAHNMHTKCVSRLQTVLESDAMRFSTWIFTTTDAGQLRLFDGKFDTFPFLSRCVQIHLELDAETKSDFIDYVHSVAAKMELGPDHRSAYAELLDMCSFNLRMALNQLASGALCV